MNDPLANRFRVEEHDALPSTQDAMKDRLRSGVDVDGLVLRARVQGAGRGRRDRVWNGEEGGSYQTAAVRDRLDDDAPQGPLQQVSSPQVSSRQVSSPHGPLGSGPSTLAVAVGIAEALRAAGAQVDVKWPNDLYYRGKKLGGILGEYLRGHLLIGVGVNVANRVPDGAAALTGWDLETVHEAVLSGIRTGLDIVTTEAKLAERFARLDLLAGHETVVDTAAGAVTGVASGIDERGRLLLRTATGTSAVADGTVRSWGNVVRP